MEETVVRSIRVLSILLQGEYSYAVIYAYRIILQHDFLIDFI